MPYLGSLDIGNRALQHVGPDFISAVDEVSQNNLHTSFAYDKTRRAELRRNVWTFSVRRAVLRALDTNTLILNPELWNEDTTYLPGAVVRDTNGLLWFSDEPDNRGNEPALSYVWDRYFGPLTVSLWDADTSYYSGELVYKVLGDPGGFVIFMSLQDSNEDVPETGTAWDEDTTYRRNEVVRHSGSQWRSLIEVNLGVTPTDGPLDWDETAVYSATQTTTGSDGFIYTSVGSGNTGNDPVSDDGSNWTASGLANAWSREPEQFQAAQSWLPLFAGAKSFRLHYPIGSGTPNSSGRSIFRLPAGYLRRAPQNPKNGSRSILGAPTGEPYNDWEYEGDFIVSSDGTPKLFRFVADVTDVTKFDDMFCEGLACRVALAVMEPLTQASGKKKDVAGQYSVFMTEARMVNAIEQESVQMPVDDYIACRV